MMVLINITLFLGDDDNRYTKGGKSKRNDTTLKTVTGRLAMNTKNEKTE